MNIAQIKKVIYDMFYAIALLIVPSLCAYCKLFLTERKIFCNDCSYKMFPIVSKKIDISSNFSVSVLAITDYKDPLKKLILAKGWSDRSASNYLGHLLWDMTSVSSLDYDFIVPIPLHWTRYAARGFNQAEEIGLVIKKKKNVPLVHLLKRVKKTEFQFELVSSMRGTNVKNAFQLDCVDKEIYKDKHILLIDDLMTTGSTIREAAKVLLQLQPAKITVAVICRVI